MKDSYGNDDEDEEVGMWCNNNNGGDDSSVKGYSKEWDDGIGR